MAESRSLYHVPVSVPGHSPSRWLLVLHGMFGTGRNWATLIRRTVAERPDWGAVLVDLREHGESRGMSPPHGLEAAANDVANLAAAIDLPVRAVLGHSFGGKVALTFARDHGADLEQVWFVESTPDAIPPAGEAWTMLGVLRRLPDRYASRLEAIAAMEREGVKTAVAQWMAGNLERLEDGSLRWAIDFQAVEDLLLDFYRTDLWSVLEAPPPNAEVHVVKATGSAVLSDAATARVRRIAEAGGHVELHEIAGGHWVNADNPDALRALLVDRLPRG